MSVKSLIMTWGQTSSLSLISKDAMCKAEGKGVDGVDQTIIKAEIGIRGPSSAWRFDRNMQK